jgi:ribosomal protein S18 acetylase RimI-like enzyme
MSAGPHESCRQLMTLPSYQVRKFRPQDRAAVRALCCETGFLGQPIDPVFEDRELFADFLTRYYLRYEPESAFVLERDGRLVGYMLGCLHPLRIQFHNALQNIIFFITLLWRYPRYHAKSRKFIRWILWNGWREVPAAPRRTPHIHINFLPEARGSAEAKELFDAFMEYLTASGVKRVYGQVVSFESRRGEAMFRRYGFRLINRSEITKYRGLHPQPVYLSTIVRDFEESPPDTIRASLRR